MTIHYSYHDQHFGYKFLLSQKQMQSLPMWLDNEEFPPLSPRVAIANASLAVRKVLASEIGDFMPKFSACSLKIAQEGCWYYLVCWFVPALDCDADWSEFSIPVLLDGTTPDALKFRFEDRLAIYKMKDES